MAKLSEALLNGNCTIINGTLVRIPEVASADGENSGVQTQDIKYDAPGAMRFIVATVLVYSVCGVLCTLITKIKRTRGKSQDTYLQDEDVSNYLKKENFLKFDGHRTKLVSECKLISEQLKSYEERQKILQGEQELSSGSTPKVKRKKKRKRKKKGQRDTGWAIGSSRLQRTRGQRLVPARADIWTSLSEAHLTDVSETEADDMVVSGMGSGDNSCSKMDST